MKPATTRPTRAMLGGLQRVRDRGSLAWCDGSRAGGAVSRMFDKMARAGLVTTPPYEITDAGKKVLQDAGR